MVTIGKLNMEIFSKVMPEIKTNAVIITETQIQHIKNRHPNDYKYFVTYIPEIINAPDYILEANRPNRLVVLKEIFNNGKHCKLILELELRKNGIANKNSIITFMIINKKTTKRLLRNKKILYNH